MRVYGDTAINSGTSTLLNVAVRDGKPVTIAARFSFVYRNRDGRSAIVDHYSSVVPAPPHPRSGSSGSRLRRAASPILNERLDTDRGSERTTDAQGRAWTRMIVCAIHARKSTEGGKS